MEDHVHLLVDVAPTIAIADLLKSIKWGSSKWIKETHIFPYFEGWGKGYFAVSISPGDKESCGRYIKNQELHHRGLPYQEELKSFVEKLGMEWYEDDWV